jgi:hypothetical protein
MRGDSASAAGKRGGKHATLFTDPSVPHGENATKVAMEASQSDSLGD